ncbi:MAG: NAD(P)H-hydrate epimerase [Planctomycetaceae bacterium]|nr:NAD(P)H-hydrate epimerase [Planctomycetaceae bacterium]
MEYLATALIRQIDAAAVQELGISSLILMENAARGACEVLESCNPQGRIIILCGPGNNGGDGLAMARLLAANGSECEVHLVRSEKTLTSDADSNLRILRNCGIGVQTSDSGAVQTVIAGLTAADWVVDAMLGTGTHGNLRAPYDEIAEAVNRSSARVMSVDVPSGLNADTGEPCGVAVRADITVTFVAKKSGFQFEHAARWLGRVDVCHIGIPQSWLVRWCKSHGE